MHERFLWPSTILVGLAATFLTIAIGNGHVGYGFPFAWKTGGCPPPGIQISAGCFLAIGYDWLRFGLDVAFYILITYVFVHAYLRKFAAKKLRTR
jgi:hypothetical protein